MQGDLARVGFLRKTVGKSPAFWHSSKLRKTEENKDFPTNPHPQSAIPSPAKWVFWQKEDFPEVILRDAKIGIFRDPKKSGLQGSGPAGRDRTRVGTCKGNVSFYFNPGRPSGNASGNVYDSFMEKELVTLWAQMEKATDVAEFSVLCERFVALTESPVREGREGEG